MSSTEYLDLADFLVVAESVLGIDTDTLIKSSRLDLADSAVHAPAAAFGGVEFYPSLARKAAVLCSRLARNHPLVDGNKRVALICMREFLARNGATWQPPPNDPEGDQTVALMETVAAGEITEDALAVWIAQRIGEAYP